MKTKNMKGFTLVELLAVIVVLALLLTLAVPSIMNARDNAVRGINNVQKKNIKVAGETLGLDLDDYMSDIYNCTEGWVSGKCETASSGKWAKVTVSLKDLVEHEYFEDAEGHCEGDLIVTKKSSGYGVDYSQVICK